MTIIKSLFTGHILELLLITLSTYMVFKARRTRRTSSARAAFFQFASVNLVFQVFNLFTNIFRDEPYLSGVGIGCFLYILLLVSMAHGSFLWFNYVEEELGPKMVYTKLRKNLWAIPVLVFAALCVLSVWTGWVFTFDENGKYQMGSLFFLQYVFIFSYVLIAMARSAANYFTAKEKRATDRVLLIVMLIDAAAAFFQLILMTNLMPIALFLNVLICYLNLYSEEVSRTLQKEEKLHAEKLAEANIRNEMLNDISNAITWSYEIGADDEIISYGYNHKGEEIVQSDGFAGNPMAWVDKVHPDDREAALQAFETAIHDHSAETPYHSTYRIIGTDGDYVWLKVTGRVYRREDGTGEMFGISLDITSQMEEQRKRLLGTIALSNDVLTKANIGLWAFELDEGQPPRMYDDETMLGLVGLDHQVPPEEAYHTWYDHIDEGSYDLVTDAVAKMSAGEHAEVQYPWHHPDGRTIMVRCGGVRNFGYTKGIRIEGTHQDVTQTLHFNEEERKRAKRLENDLIMAKLRADSLAFISDNEPDLDSAISFFGNRILEISGCDQVVYRELGGRKIVLNVPGSEDVPETICSRCPFARFDCEAFQADGTVLMNDCRMGYHGIMAPADCPARSSFMQMIYSGGNIVGILTVHYLKEPHVFTGNAISLMKTVAIYLGLMIGRIKAKQAEIARIAAESSNKAKTEFLFNMSHDIRTPMNAVLGYTDIAIRHTDEPEKVNESLKKIKMAGGHLLSLINDILEMSRIEAGVLEIVNAPMDIREAIDGIDLMSQALAVPKSIDYRTIVRNIRNPYVYADELHINQIIINLISNAVKYTNHGGKVEYIAEQISEPAEGISRYRFTVRDTGIGMSEDFQKHLFENFSREKDAAVARQEGAGLGLAIVKRITDLAGGTIEVHSVKGEGSTFAVELPFRVMDEDAVNHFKSEHDRDILSEDADLDGKKVLLVEDNEMNREIATELLKEIGLVTETAEDGELAVKAVSEKGVGYYDFILMDIQMPMMNGYDATRIIRSLPGGDKVPIIALSANAFEEDKQKSLEAGMKAHVAKPINMPELLKAMNQVTK